MGIRRDKTFLDVMGHKDASVARYPAHAFVRRTREDGLAYALGDVSVAARIRYAPAVGLDVGGAHCKTAIPVGTFLPATADAKRNAYDQSPRTPRSKLLPSRWHGIILSSGTPLGDKQVTTEDQRCVSPRLVARSNNVSTIHQHLGLRPA